jgi:hypothetical protein
MTARPFVELTIPPYEGELDSWGKDSRGQWWALVTWYEDVVLPKQMGRSSVLPCSGWVAARHLRKRASEDYSAVLRVVLPEDQGLWPLPTDRGPNFWWSDRAHHIGILTEAPRASRRLRVARGHSGVTACEGQSASRWGYRGFSSERSFRG